MRYLLLVMLVQGCVALNPRYHVTEPKVLHGAGYEINVVTWKQVQSICPYPPFALGCTDYRNHKVWVIDNDQALRHECEHVCSLREDTIWWSLETELLVLLTPMESAWSSCLCKDFSYAR